jgi:DUF2407 C-terminal domain
LASAGFTEEDIANIRRQFHSQSHGDYLDRDFTNEEECKSDLTVSQERIILMRVDDEHARALEEQWIDSLDNAGTASLSQSSPASSSTLLQGIVIGLFFPLMPFFFFREPQPPVFWDDGAEYETLASVVFSSVTHFLESRRVVSLLSCGRRKRMQMGLVVGFIVNLCFGLWIYLVAGS